MASYSGGIDGPTKRGLVGPNVGEVSTTLEEVACAWEASAGVLGLIDVLEAARNVPVGIGPERGVFAALSCFVASKTSTKNDFDDGG